MADITSHAVTWRDRPTQAVILTWSYSPSLTIAKFARPAGMEKYDLSVGSVIVLLILSRILQTVTAMRFETAASKCS
jgi:hypothetical protein